jgi:hypothetical protein
VHGGHSTLAPTDDLCLAPATAQADRLRIGAVSTAEFVTVHIERIERLARLSSLAVRPGPSPTIRGMGLRRFWSEFEPPPTAEKEPSTSGVTIDGGGIWSFYLSRGCGVTAHDQDEALDLIREMTRQLPGSEAEPLPAVGSIVADVDVSNLPEYARTAGVPVWRGVWYPPENLRGPR